jgi:uncharacterized protein
VARRLLTFAVFISVLSGLLGAVHYAVYARLFVSPALGDGWVRFGAYLCATLAVATPVGMVVSRRTPRQISVRIAGAAFSWLGIVFMLLSAIGAGELARLALSGVVPEPRLSRGIAVAVAATVVLATASGVQSALGTVPVKRVTIALAGFPENLVGFKLVQLSDIHIGPMLGRDWLARVVATVNELEPDAVAITGDLVDGSVRRLKDEVSPLADLVAKHGTFFVTGNHEYYSGADEWIAELRRLGLTVLRNERQRLGGDDGFDIAGVDDWTAFGEGHGPDLAAALADRDEQRPVVLLAHQPRQIHQAVEAGVALQLSGHTHGGQIFPWNFFVRLQQPHVAGLVRRGDTQLYTSRGTGYWGPPLRVGAPPEITLIELVAASPAP